MSCTACRIAADNPLSGLADQTCRACRVRETAKAPRHIRQAAYAALPEEERAAFVADVAAEARRLSEAKARLRVERAWGPIEAGSSAPEAA